RANVIPVPTGYPNGNDSIVGADYYLSPGQGAHLRDGSAHSCMFHMNRQGESSMQHTTQRPATESGTLTIGGDLKVYRLGFGTMRLTGPGIWGPPADRQEALAVLHHALDLGVNL